MGKSKGEKCGFKVKWKNREMMLRFMLQSGLYYKKLFLNLKFVAYKWERLQIESGLWWSVYGKWKTWTRDSKLTKLGADKLAENTSNAPKFICQNGLTKPKSLGFWWKKASLSVRSPWARVKGFIALSFKHRAAMWRQGSSLQQHHSSLTVIYS